MRVDFVTDNGKRSRSRRTGLFEVLVLPLVLVACGDSGGSGTGSDSRTGTETTATEASTSVPTTGDAGSTTDSEAVPTTGMSGDESTGMPACGASPDDCPASACQRASCVEGRCIYDNLPDGTAATEQPPGDCAVAVCDGAGEVRRDADPDDLPDDGVACTVDSCDGLTPVNTPQTMPCYTGMDGTQDVGQCVGGTRTCDPAMGDFGACEGEVVPAVEDCDAAQLDEDCDGAVDEDGPGCVCGDGILSAGEACDDGDVVDADTCSSTCKLQEVLQVEVSGHTCARLTAGSVKCWGFNGSGDLGLGDTENRGNGPGEMGAALPPVDLVAGLDAASLSTSAFHTCVRMGDGGVKCWGFNFYGQLGLGDPQDRGDEPGEMGAALPYVDLGPGVTTTAVTTGYQHTCALLSDGRVKCWGDNQYGQLGLGDTARRGDGPGEMGADLPAVDLGPGATAIAVDAGNLHSCALLLGGDVKCWGFGLEGQLGLGDNKFRGDGPGEMGAMLPPVDLGGPAIAISTGLSFTCALLSDGSVKCWGYNGFGQLGLGDTQNRGDNPGEMGPMLPAVALAPGKLVASIHAGRLHTCVRLEDSSVQCWGRNGYGELGLGDTQHRGDGPGEMGASLPIVDLGAGLSAVSLDAGGAYNFFAHTCAVLSDGSAKCWGYNGSGELGLGDTQDRGDEPGEMGDNLPRIKLFSDAW